jgi:hypothetical protein
MSGEDVIKTAGSGIMSALNGLSNLFYKGFDKLFNWIGSFFHGDGTKSEGTSRSVSSSSSDQDAGTRYQTMSRMRSRRNDFSLAANTGVNSDYSMPASRQTSYPASRTSYASSMGGMDSQRFAFNVMPRFNENSFGMRHDFGGGRQMAFAHGCHHFGGGRGFHR